MSLFPKFSSRRFQETILLIRLRVFLPPFLAVVVTVISAMLYPEKFLIGMKLANDFILDHFGWLFSLTTFSILVLLIILFFSPIGNKRIGGEDAQPLLNRWQWFSISLCTTIATGILFWGTAEPLFHYYETPEGVPASSG